MKTENTLRTVRNSLLCFFTALGAGFLVACGGGGGSTPTFSTYLTDAPVEGAEYSGPTSSDVTGKVGVFTASEGMFEFSVGATTLGSVRLNSDWADSHVTPADFIGFDTDEKVITIARILQGLDDPTDGTISISQSDRDGLTTVDLFSSAAFIADLTTARDDDDIFTFAVGSVTLMVPSAAKAEERLIATRQCLYSGGYMGSYRSTVTSDEGRSHFVFEPRSGNAISLRGVEFAISPDGSRGDAEFGMGEIGTIRASGNTYTTTRGSGDTVNSATWTFVTPRLITSRWVRGANSGTSRLTRVAGDPTANRRVVGVETEGSDTAGIYVLDYFADDSEFRGQYYDVETDQYSVMLLTVAGGSDGDPWPADTTGEGSTVTLTLSGTLGGGDTNVTVQVVRDTDTRGSFVGATGATNMLDGSWCDLRTTTTAAIVSGGALVESLAMSHSQIGGDVSAHRFSRYLDSGFPANTAIDGVQILG